MKAIVLLSVALFLISGLQAKSDVPVFGNCHDDDTSAFGIAASSSGQASGGAVGFTPTEDLSVSSVTLWLNGYTGQNDQSYYAEICENYAYSGGNEPSGIVIANFACPTPNNGSTKAFTFTDPTGPVTLDNGQEYWLLIYGVVPSQPGFVSSQWIEGGSPLGNAVYDGAESFAGYSFYNSSATPAFTVNAVPEPGSMTLMIVPAILGAGRKFYKRWKSRS